MTPAFPRALAPFLVAIIGVLAVVHVLHYAAPFEDSYITYRYARNVARGLGVVYNAGERVEGCTSLSWTLVLALFAKLGGSLPAAATALALAAAAALVVATGYVARHTAARSGQWFLVAPALVSANGTFAYFAGTGMETVFFALLVLAGVALSIAEGKRAGLLLGASLGLAATTRPEGAGYAAVILCALAFSPAGRAKLGAAAAVFGALFAGLCGFRYAYFGDLLPNTYYAKATPGLALWLAGWRYVEEYLTFWGGFVAVAAFVSLLRARRAGIAGRFHRVAAAVCAAALVNSVLVGGDTFLFHRFLLPAVPLAAIAVAHAAEELARVRALPASAGVVALVAWSVTAGFVPRLSITRRGAPPFARLATDVAAINEHYFAVGAWLRDHLPKEATVALNAAGIVPYVSDLPTLDMLGLTDAHIARRPIPLGQHFHGHEKYDPDYVLERDPDVIIPGLPVLSKTRVRVTTLAAWYAPWAAYLPGDAQLLQKTRFGERYTLRVVPVRSGEFLVLFVKKASPLARVIQSAP